MGRIIVALCLGLVTASGFGCYSPPHPECGFVCGTSGQCPAEYSCNSVDNVCHLNGSSPTMICAVDARIGQDTPPSEGVGFHVTSNTPTNLSVMVSRTEPILVQFDRSAMGSTITNSTFVVEHTAIQVPGTISYIDATDTAQFLPAPTYPPGARIDVSLTSFVSSSLGEPLAAYTFSFTTLDDAPPTFVNSNPMDMTTAIPVNTTIAVTFNEAVMNVTSTTFAVTQGVTPITGTYASGDAMTWTMTPGAALPAASVITVSLTAGITDLAGNQFLPLQISFTTQ